MRHQQPKTAANAIPTIAEKLATVVLAAPVACAAPLLEAFEALPLCVPLPLPPPAPFTDLSAFADGYNKPCTISSALKTSPRFPSVTVAADHLLSGSAQLKPHAVSLSVVQPAAAALAEIESIFVIGSATTGAASAARARLRAKIPLNAR
jgi:hypothetical protein